MEIIIHILLGLAISFIGTLPLGIINLTIVDQTMKKGSRTGLLIAAGSITVEFFQTLIAFQFAALLARLPAYGIWFHAIALPVFAGLSLYYFLNRHQAQLSEQKRKNSSPYLLGMAISAANLMIFPYWIGWGGMLQSHGWLRLDFLYIVLFAIGTVFGTFLALYLFVRLSLWISKRFQDAGKWSNYIIALVFLVLALGEMWTVVSMTIF